MVVAILILALLTIIGIAAMNTTNVELKISGNEKSYKMALYAAEAARGYVAKTSESHTIESSFYLAFGLGRPISLTCHFIFMCLKCSNLIS